MWIAAVLIIWAGGVAQASPHFSRKAAQLDRCIAGLARTLPANVANTLERIEGRDRRLLALRSYLRNSGTLAARWSWPEAQIRAYERSAEYRAVQSELTKVVTRFEALHPGYTLYVNSQVRSLDTQIRRWNDNASVGAVARALEKVARRQPSGNSCSGKIEPADGPFARFLMSWSPRRSPTLAAPGLSKHGQARAFDFQIKRGNEIVAGTDSARSVSAWDKQGWTRKLRDAVSSASGKFAGPLQTPYEPWHYEYNP